MLKGPSTDTWYLQQLGRKVSAVEVPDRETFAQEMHKKAKDKNRAAAYSSDGCLTPEIYGAGIQILFFIVFSTY